MHKHWFRTALILAACLALSAARKDFWEIKDPSTWSIEEKQVLLVQSPWAKEGFVLMDVGKKRDAGAGYGNNGRKGGDMPDLRPGAPAGGQRGVPMGEVPPVPNSDSGPPVKFRVLVRWENAVPVRLAGRPEAPEVAGQFYVLRLRGLPLMPPPKAIRGETAPNPNIGLLQAIKDGSFLERKDKPAIPCAHLFTGSGEESNQVLLFFARREDDPITIADKLVTLESRFAAFHLSIKFPLKDMLFQGELSL